MKIRFLLESFKTSAIAVGEASYELRKNALGHYVADVPEIAHANLLLARTDVYVLYDEEKETLRAAANQADDDDGDDDFDFSDETFDEAEADNRDHDERAAQMAALQAEAARLEQVAQDEAEAARQKAAQKPDEAPAPRKNAKAAAKVEKVAAPATGKPALGIAFLPPPAEE